MPASRFLIALGMLWVALASRAAGVEASSPCAATLQALSLVTGDPLFPLRWEETSMSDGKPLVVSITEKEGALFLEFKKTQEGLWAEGTALVCRGSAGFEARMGQIRMGPAAHWLLRQSSGQGRTFAMSRGATGQLRIATLGWSGTFRPKASAD